MPHDPDVLALALLELHGDEEAQQRLLDTLDEEEEAEEEEIDESCEPNKTGGGHHDSETGRPCSTDSDAGGGDDDEAWEPASGASEEDNMRSLAQRAMKNERDYKEVRRALNNAGYDADSTVAQYLIDHETDGQPNSKLPEQSHPALSLSEKAAVWDYTREAYDSINADLRSGADPADYVLQTAVLKVAPFADPIRVRRGLELDAADAESFAASLSAAASSGELVRFDGFTSATTSAPFPGNVQLAILARQGIDAQIHGVNSGELILPAGSEFRVVSAKYSGGRLVAELEQIVAAQFGNGAEAQPT